MSDAFFQAVFKALPTARQPTVWVVSHAQQQALWQRGLSLASQTYAELGAHQVISIDGWIRQWTETCWWQGIQSEQATLSANVSLERWTEVMRQQTNSLHQPQRLAQRADQSYRRAWQSIDAARQPGLTLHTASHFAQHATEDTQAFAQWVTQFERQDSLHPMQAEHHAYQHIAAHATMVPQQADANMQWCAVDESFWTPRQKSWLALLRTQLKCPALPTLTLDAQQLERTETPNPQSTWAVIEQWITDGTQAKTVAVLCPEPSQLALSFRLATQQSQATHWLEHLHAPLQDDLTIQTTVLWLKWLHQSLELNELETLLQGRWLMPDELQHDQLSAWLKMVYQQQRSVLSLANALDIPYEHATWHQVLHDAEAKQQVLLASERATTWAKHIKALLHEQGWSTHTTPHAHRLLESLDDLVLDLQTETHFNPPSAWLRWQTRINALTQTLPGVWSSKQPVLLATRPSDVLTAPLDAAIHLGFDTDRWPNAMPYDALLGQAFMRTHLPEATDSIRWRSHVQSQHQAVMQSIPKQLCCHVMQDAEQDRHLSPMLSSFFAEAKVWLPPALDVQPELVTESFNDPEVLPIADSDRKQGGSDLIYEQSACAFRAFALKRLNADPWPRLEAVVNARTRGIMIHKVLERLWRELGQQAALLALSADEQLRLVEHNVDQVIQQQQWASVSPWLECIWQNERAALVQLIQDWLAIERTRPGFKITHTEHKQSLRLDELSLHLRIDRIDTTDDQRRLVIDYKTGQLARTQNWLDERLSDTQLPLYFISASQHQQVDALLLANIHPAQVGWQGVARSDLKEQFNAEELTDDISAHWQQVLTQLANDFVQGRAEVNPRHRTTCTYCHLHAVCRIREYSEEAAA